MDNDCSECGGSKEIAIGCAVDKPLSVPCPSCSAIPRSITCPVVAARAAAEEIVRLVQDEYEHGAASVEPKIAAIITRHFAATTSLSSEAAVGHAKNPDAFCLACNEHPCKLIAPVPAAGDDEGDDR